MDEELESLVVKVRADGAGFAREVAAMRRELSEGIGEGAGAAARGLENALLRATRNGRVGFDDLGRAALRTLGQIAAEALKIEVGGGGQGALTAAIAGLLGAPGRAVGGLVSPGKAYRVGEAGPETFVPASSGRIVPHGGGGRGPVNVTVNVAVPRDAGAPFMARTGAQIARQLRQVMGSV
ncbi:tail tape measure protein [Sandaracinobacteroides saxicola]|uniref:Tail tape measure protein n=1 Tax=Sandaracinobacteroides saxicola TaxID=2759707 RepID=A0A7G5IJ48_9SPHN|nr:tail tape measure protein [Sandaracinobacteroides saxicola]QMW23390.1 tail tape measure protein [Sandaracinobacteroides saxicola]